MKYILIAILVVSSLHADNNVTDNEKILAQKLFEKVFKQKSKENRLYMPLNVNHILQDEIFVKIDEHQDLFIAKETIEYILTLLKDEYKNKFILKNKKKEFYPLNILNQFGIIANYDRENILINVHIPPKLKKASLLNFNKVRNKDISGAILPENYSGGANFYFNQNYTGSNDLADGSLTASSDVFINVHDTILEGRIQYQENSSSKITRDRFRLLKDDEENQIRYTLGDIILPRQYRMGFTDALGFTIEKKFEINRDFTQNISRVSSYEFFLKNSSTIEVFINEKFYTSFPLKAGTHNLYDLGLPAGINEIKLKIIEDSGKIEYIEFNDFSYSEVLEKGLAIYGVGAGIRSEKEENEWAYIKDEQLLSAYIDYGLTNDITIKTGLQLSNQDYHSEALEFLVGTNFGLINPYIIYSDNGEIKGYKKGLDYRTNIDRVTFNLSYFDADENFRQLNTYQNNFGEINRLYRANIYAPIGDTSNIGLSASQYLRGEEKEDKYRLSFYKRFSQQLEFRADFDRIKKENDINEDRLYFTLDYRFDNNRLSYINYAIENRHQINADYRSDGRYGTNTSALYEHDNEYDRYYARTNVNDEKFKIDATYNMLDNKNKDARQSASIQLATGFVVAGDSATITTPMTSGFVIVNNSDEIQDSLGVEGYQDSEDYIYETFTIPLSDYTTRELEVDETELDFGIDLVAPQQQFITNFKSGLVMDIEVKSLYSVVGTLLDKKTNSPIKDKTFKVFNTKLGKKSIGFTNEKGEFTIQEVEEGQHNITFYKERDYDGVAKFSFTIDNRNKGKNLIDLGNIYIEMPKKKEAKKYLIYNKKSQKIMSQEIQNALKTVYFESNSYAVKEKEQAKLNKLAEVLKQYKELKIDVIGHANKGGSQEYKMELSHRRAKSVKEYLISKGVQGHQLNALGMGMKKAIYETDEENRRAEFTNQVIFQVR